MKKTTATILKDALRLGELVRFERRFDEGTICGYVLDVGPKFFLLLVVSSAIRFDGFCCMRISDVMSWENPMAEFVESALKKKGERKPRKPRVSLENIEKLLLTAGRAFPLVTIERGETHPEVCQIGRIVKVSKKFVTLQEIGPDAKWYGGPPDDYPLREITCVEFGGDYERALYMVGGAPGSAK